MTNPIPQDAINAAAAALDPSAFGSEFEINMRRLHGETSTDETRNRLQTDAKRQAAAALEAAMPHIRQHLTTEIWDKFETQNIYVVHDEVYRSGVEFAVNTVDGKPNAS